MNEKILKTKKEIITEDGDWSAHNIFIRDNFYTIGNTILNDEYKLKRVLQNISDFTQKPFSELKILDLACLEGLFGVECARQGASVTFLDARKANLRKVKFVTDLLDLRNIQIVEDDVRKISIEKYGKYDVILCFGIFYHLDKYDLYPFVQKMFEMTNSIVIFDTHISLSHKETYKADGVDFFGSSYVEHRSDATIEEKEKELWKSLDNQKSFKLTKESLVRMLKIIGFTSVVESYLPVDSTKLIDRITLTAFKGKPLSIYSSPKINDIVDGDIPEYSSATFLKKKISKTKDDVIYNLKLRSPNFIRQIYKRYFKKN